MVNALRKLNDTELAKIVGVKPTLACAAQLVSIPWQMIASVWYRESFSVTNPSVPGGPFQFDPLPISAILQTLLKAYTTLPEAACTALIFKGVEDFATAAIFAGCFLCNKCKYDLQKQSDDIAVKDAFYGYNGRAWGPHPESSPYVMNDYDLDHQDMVIRGSIPDKNNPGKRIWINNVDQRPGAFTVYKQLIFKGV